MAGSLTGLDVGAVFGGRFTIEQRIGEGALGEVFRVTAAGKQFALKILSPKVVPSYISATKIDAVLQESKIQHPGVVTPLEVGEADGYKFILMPHVSGASLRDLLTEMADDEQIADAQTTAIILDRIGAVLSVLPPFVVHGALKPSNILVPGMQKSGPFPDDAHVCITDFGACNIISFSKYASLQLSAGKPYYYLAPEFISFGGKVDQRADQFAMGVLAYELLTGKVPRKGAKPVTELNPDLPEEWDDFVFRMMAKRPEDRFTKPADVRQALTDLVGEIPAAKPYPELSAAGQMSIAEAAAKTLDEFDALLDGAIASGEKLESTDTEPVVFAEATVDALSEEEAGQVVESEKEAELIEAAEQMEQKEAWEVSEAIEEEIVEEEPAVEEAVEEEAVEEEPVEEEVAEEEAIEEEPVEEKVAEEEEAIEEEPVEEEVAEEEAIEEEPVEEEVAEEEAVEEEPVEEEVAEEEAVEEEPVEEEVAEEEAIEEEPVEEEVAEEEAVEEEPVEEEVAEEEAVEEEPVEEEIAEEEAIEEEPVEEEVAEEEAIEEEPVEEKVAEEEEAIEEEPVEEEVAEEEAIEEEPVEEEVAEEEAVEEEPVEEEVAEEEAIEEEPVEEEVAEEEAIEDEPAEEEVTEEEAIEEEPAEEEVVAEEAVEEEPAEEEIAEEEAVEEEPAEEEVAEEEAIEEEPVEEELVEEEVAEEEPIEEEPVEEEAVKEEPKEETELPTLPRPPKKKFPAWGIAAIVVVVAAVVALVGYQQGWFGQGAAVPETTPTPIAAITPEATPDATPEITPEESPTPENVAEEIKTLIAQADKYINQKAYVRPKTACALTVIKQIQKLDPNHAYPSSAKQKMLDDLKNRIDVAMANENYQEAYQLARDALEIKPGDKGFYQAYIDAKAKMDGDKQEKQLAALVAKLKSHINKKRYVTPPNNCALLVIGQIEDIDPNHPEIAKAKSTIINDLLQKANKHLSNEDWNSAITSAQAGLQFDPTHAKLKSILEKAKKGKQATPTPEATPVVVKKCPAGMRYIAGGSVRMGSSPTDPMRKPGEKPNSPVYVAPYCIDLYEYPNQPGHAPRVNVSWNTARQLCAQQNKRLCSEREWERACKGPGNRRFPYGNNFNPNVCATQDDTGNERSVAGSGGWAGCRSSFGIYDLSGNVREWTSSPVAPGQPAYVVKGGSANQPDWAVRCAVRQGASPGTASYLIGFRCCSDPLE